MKVCILYKGGFNYKHFIQNGVDDKIKIQASKNVINHDNFFQNLFRDANIEYHFSTYEVFHELDELYLSKYNPKYYNRLDSSFLSKWSSWDCQLIHYKYLIDSLANTDYDLYVFTRPDIEFLRNMKIEEIDIEKFNIVVEHGSGNCDDNFWIFSPDYLLPFSKSVDTLLSQHRITHEINHELNKYKVPLNYIETINNSEHGHTLFTFLR